LLVEVLETNGVEYIFGVPGDIENEFFGDLQDSSIEFFNTMHEQSGAIMADVYSRLTGNVGVCFSTLGPGATNMLTGVTNAFQDRSAVLALSGQLPSENQHQDSHQYVELPSVYDSVSKEAFTIQRSKDIAVDINKALYTAKLGREGPVHVGLPIDVLKGDGSSHKTTEYSKTSKTNNKKAIKNLYAEIEDANSVIAIIGNCTTASEELKQFLDEYNIPFYTSFQGKGVVSSDYPLNCGVLSRHSEIVKETLANQDLILTIGYDLIEGVTPDMWSGARTVAHIDETTPTGPAHIYSPDMEIIGDISNILEQIVTQFNPVKNEVEEIDSMVWKIEAPEGIDEIFPLHPAKVVKSLNNLLSDQDIVVPDVGLHKQAVGLYYEAKNPNTVLFSNGLSQMGFSVPASIAAQFVYPERQIVGVSGDGGFHMNIQELTTAVEKDIPVTYLVFNDGAYGMVKHAQLESEGTHYRSEFRSPQDFARIAEGFGATGMSVESTDEIQNVLSNALSLDGVVVVDVPIQQYNEIEMIQ
jgi:acetolactate synthase-1/2/3 large subunit